MAPPMGPLNLDVEAISGICGSISIAAWVVVFSPQIIENFRRGSADGLSVQFIIAWLLGDVFNILGAVLQGVLPTMLILAMYYAIADVVLLTQCFYYKGLTWRDDDTSLLAGYLDRRERRGSNCPPLPAPTKLQSFLWNAVAVLMVCAAGVLGWLLSRGRSTAAHHKPTTTAPTGGGGGGGDDDDSLLALDLWGQVFGWLCAALYLGSRLPQLLLNFRRRSTEGISVLFFLFACLGNLTYVLSIFAYDPVCRGHQHRGARTGTGTGTGCQPGEASRIYARYLLVNASWLAGSLGTLLLDLGIFAQFFLYGQDADGAGGEVIDDDDESDMWDQRPLLDRGASDFP
ncbi:putative pq loop repeat protein [Rosellinia necatrix]|uniref:Putative pq loop repeat protein n=1 Tax=Rosellinia necatrix TaxID=77044 RepID=A0A1W2TET5_ROSNE|nr:putative pq loop repeat protein [Rosellinia necatrix]